MAEPVRVFWDRVGRGAWDDLLRRDRCPLQQGWTYGEALQAGGTAVHRVAFGASPDAPEAVAQVAVRRWLGLLPVALLMRGPVGRWDPAAVARALRERFPRCFILWNPADRALPGKRVVTGYATAWLDLERDDQALFKTMDVRWRHRLKRALGGPLQVLRDRDGAIESWLIQRDLVHRREVGYRGPPPAFLTRLRACAPQERLVLAAQLNGETVAGVLLQRHAASATYLVGWTATAGRDADAHRLLLWQAARLLRDAGVRWLDLGGIATDRAPGPTRFKLQTGAEPVIEPGTWLLPPRLFRGGGA